MPTQPSLNLIPTIQQAIMSLLLTYEPVFIQFGYTLFVAFATILIAWNGIRMMFSRDGLGDQMFDFAKLLLFISFGYALIAFYESPLPGIGVSFSNLITDQAGYFQSVLEARAFDNIYRHFDELSEHFMQPDPWSILANLIYWTVLLLIAFAKAVSLAVIAFGLTSTLAVGLALLFATGFVHSFCITPLAAVMLRSSEERMRGRVMGVRMLAIWGLPLGLLLAGPLIAGIGYVATTVLYGALGLAATVTIGYGWRRALWHRSAQANV